MKDIAAPIHLAYISKNSIIYQWDRRNDFYELDYFYIVKDFLAEPYKCFHKNPWTYCNIYNDELLTQGWKIHISGTVENHIDILKLVTAFASENKLNFKFASNYKCFVDLNGKAIDRSGAGKFIVIYPHEDEFDRVINELYYILRKYKGPYILSDRPYKDSKVIYYRYGEINPVSYTDEYGTITTKILNNNNELSDDIRAPFFILPEGVCDIYDSNENVTKSLLLDKYNITEVLHFSSQGGIYIGKRKTDDLKVVIKEAREYCGLDYQGEDGTSRLLKEMKFLNDLQSNNLPIVYEKIEEGGNFYLIQEYIKGDNLKSIAFYESPIINGRNGNLKRNEFDKKYKRIVYKSLLILEEIHRMGVAINDISPTNIIYDNETEAVKFIDFETIEKFGHSHENVLCTLGFSDQYDYCCQESDLKSLVKVFMYCLFPVNNILVSFPEKDLEILNTLYKWGFIENTFMKLFGDILMGKVNTASRALELLMNNTNKVLSDHQTTNLNISTHKNLLLDSLVKRISLENDFDRNIIPCDPMGFMTNQYCIAFGVLGELYALKKINTLKNVGSEIIGKIVKNFMVVYYKNSNKISDGLWVGKAGIAIALFELGFTREAKLVEGSIDINNSKMSDWLFGLSGIGISYLYFYLNTKDEYYSECAKKCCDSIEEKCILADGVYKWKDLEGDAYIGFTRGASGIALLYLYMSIAFNDSDYLMRGEIYLSSDLDYLIYDEIGLLGFDVFIDSKDDEKVYSPYIHNGISGLGIVLIRYFLATKNNKYRDIIEDIIDHLSYLQITLFPGYLRGMSGIMNFLTDCINYLDSKKALSLYKKFEKEMGLYIVEREGEFGVVGDELFKISDDLATGLSGLILTISREKKRENDFLFVDELMNNYK